MFRTKKMYERYEYQKRLTNLFTYCINIINDLENYPLDKQYTNEEMKYFIENNAYKVIELISKNENITNYKVINNKCKKLRKCIDNLLSN